MVTMDQSGNVLDEFDTLVNPLRDPGVRLAALGTGLSASACLSTGRERTDNWDGATTAA